MMGRSEFLGDGWTATVEVRGGVIEVTVLLAGVGIPASARLVLPLAHAGESLATLVAVLYSDELLLRSAVEVHLGQHPQPVAVSARNTAHAKNTTRAGSSTCSRRNW